MSRPEDDKTPNLRAWLAARMPPHPAEHAAAREKILADFRAELDTRFPASVPSTEAERVTAP